MKKNNKCTVEVTFDPNNTAQVTLLFHLAAAGAHNLDDLPQEAVHAMILSGGLRYVNIESKLYKNKHIKKALVGLFNSIETNTNDINKELVNIPIDSYSIFLGQTKTLSYAINLLDRIQPPTGDDALYLLERMIYTFGTTLCEHSIDKMIDRLVNKLIFCKSNKRWVLFDWYHELTYEAEVEKVMRKKLRQHVKLQNWFSKHLPLVSPPKEYKEIIDDVDVSGVSKLLAI